MTPFANVIIPRWATRRRSRSLPRAAKPRRGVNPGVRFLSIIALGSVCGASTALAPPFSSFTEPRAAASRAVGDPTVQWRLADAQLQAACQSNWPPIHVEQPAQPALGMIAPEFGESELYLNSIDRAWIQQAHSWKNSQSTMRHITARLLLLMVAQPAVEVGAIAESEFVPQPRGSPPLIRAGPRETCLPIASCTPCIVDAHELSY